MPTVDLADLFPHLVCVHINRAVADPDIVRINAETTAEQVDSQTAAHLRGGYTAATNGGSPIRP